MGRNVLPGRGSIPQAVSKKKEIHHRGTENTEKKLEGDKNREERI
jgi:hypothetical protein